MKSFYLLDSNIFIQANRMNYPFDIFPGFWEWLDNEHERGVLGSILPVAEELKVGNDLLSKWVIDRVKKNWFLSVEDPTIQKTFNKIAGSKGINDPVHGFKEHVISEFLNIADSWLIANASVAKCTIVTHETYEPNRKNKIKIPNVCSEFGIKYINITALLRKSGVQFYFKKNE